MSAVVIAGDTSGSVTLNAPAVAGTTTLTLPATSGTVTTKDTNGILSVNGVQFPATQSASADANCLDDYEEGTWTPVVQGSTSAGTATYATQSGQYTKIGNRVLFNCRIDYSAGNGTGNLRVGGLPFTNSSVVSSVVVYIENITLTASNIPVCIVGASQTYMSIDQTPLGGGSATAVTYDGSGGLILAGQYSV